MEKWMLRNAFSRRTCRSQLWLHDRQEPGPVVLDCRTWSGDSIGPQQEEMGPFGKRKRLEGVKRRELSLDNLAVFRAIPASDGPGFVGPVHAVTLAPSLGDAKSRSHKINARPRTNHDGRLSSAVNSMPAGGDAHSIQPQHQI